MLSKLAIGAALMAVCVTIHAMGLVAVIRMLKTRVLTSRKFWACTWTLIRIAGWTVFLHLVQIVVWAALYAWTEALSDFTTAAYFSAVTYTTTGYGDLVLPPDWRLVGGIEALTGILMCGLSAGMFFAAFNEIFVLDHGESSRDSG